MSEGRAVVASVGDAGGAADARPAGRAAPAGAALLGAARALALVLVAIAAGCTSTPETAEQRATESVKLYKDGVARFEQGAPNGDAAAVDAAIELLQRAKRLTPDYTKLRVDLARMLIHRAVFNDTVGLIAHRDGEKLRNEGKLGESDRKTYEGRVLYDAARRDLLEAKSDLQYAESAVTPEQLPNIYYFLTQVFTGLEEFGEARNHLQKAIDTAKSQGIPITLEKQDQLTKLRQTLDQLEEEKKKRSQSP